MRRRFSLGSARPPALEDGDANESETIHQTKLFAIRRPSLTLRARKPKDQSQPPLPAKRTRSFSVSGFSLSMSSSSSSAPSSVSAGLAGEGEGAGSQPIPPRPNAHAMGPLGLAAHHLVSAGLGLFKGLQSVSGESESLSFGEAHTIGRRPYMEDRFSAELALTNNPAQSLFGVFDGHGGERAAQFCSDNIPAQVKSHPQLAAKPELALSDAFEKVDQDFCKLAASQYLDDGTTAVVVLVRGKTVWCANTGDSRCVLSRNAIAVPLSDDHKPDGDIERRRIIAAGGFVKFLGVWRVQGVLAVARAIGDLSIKRFVPPTPDVRKVELDDSDDFLILASDGLWDVMTNQEAVDHLHTRPQLLVKPDQAARALVAEAFRRGSFDNITAVVVVLRKRLVKASSRVGNLESMAEESEVVVGLREAPEELLTEPPVKGRFSESDKP